MTKQILPDEVLSQHVAVLGKTRSGKSSVMRGLVEGLLEREQPVCIVDPKGDWWGIKLAKDGKRPGYPVVIFGGKHADVPINAHAGAHVAELFATGNRPCLIDLGEFMVGERTRFWIDFASTLFKLTLGMRWLVVDEVHNFAPKGKIMDPDAGKALHWSNRLASEGLGKGLHMVIASQRPQKVHNDTLTSCETLIAMRVLHPSDRGAVSEWIDGCGDPALGKTVLQSLGQMDRGEGWAWSPEIKFGPERVKFPMFKTYDSFRPQTAEDVKSLKGWADVDLDDVKAKLADVVKEAEKNDPKILNQRIAELERDAKKPRELAVDTDMLAQYEDRGRENGFHAGRLAGRSEAIAHMKSAIELYNQTPMPAPEKSSITRSVKATVSSVSVPVREKRTPADTGVALQKAERKVLTALAQYPQGRTQVQVAVLTGYAIGGGGFRNAIGAMRSRGYIVGSSDRLTITREGQDALGAYTVLPTGAALLEHWLGRLGKAEREILKTLAGVYPNSLTVEAVAIRTHYEPSGGGFRNALGRLRTLELIKGRGELKASEDLF